MKKPFSNKLLIVFVGLIIVSAFVIVISKGRKKEFNQGTAVVERAELIQRSTIAGTIIPARKTIITAPYQGYVKKVFVVLGQSIKAGDPVASISPTLVASDEVFPLRSPFSGRVVQLNKSEGEFVKANDANDFISRIDDTSKFFVESNVPELDRVKMEVGLEAEVKATAVLDHTYKGVVREMSYAARESDRWGRSTSVDFPMRLEILNPDKDLQSGMSVIVDIITLKKEDILRLRHEYIGKEKNGYFVTLEDGTEKPVKVGVQNEEYTEILDGVSEGTKVQKVNFSKLIENQ